VANPRPDVNRQWISIWGANHFGNTTGPSSGYSSSVHLLTRLQPGNVTPDQLVLDIHDHPGRTELDLGVDLRRLQVTPAAARPARRKSQPR
jgi:hypothetical protein